MAISAKSFSLKSSGFHHLNHAGISKTCHIVVKTNGGFEQWTGNQPDSWSLKDSGITLSQSATIKLSGNSAAAISVNTADQANTDFRQLVNVSAGQTYNFSTAVYHTEGNGRARLYVNGYQGYSNEQ